MALCALWMLSPYAILVRSKNRRRSGKSKSAALLFILAAAQMEQSNHFKNEIRIK